MNEKAITVANDQAHTELAIRRESAGFAAGVRNEVGVIAGIDDTNQFRYRFPRLSKLHLGVKKQTNSGKEYPSAVDYFVLSDDLLADEKFLTVLAEQNDDPTKPRKLPIRLVSHNLADNVRSSLDYYGSNRGLKCRSYDGLTRQCVNDKTGEMETAPCANVNCPVFKKGDCQVITRLRFMLPDAQGIGTRQIDTRSVNNRANLPCEMMVIRAATRGKLAGLDLALTLEPEEKVIEITGKDGKPVSTKKVVWLMHLRTDLTPRELERAARDLNGGLDLTEVEDFDTSYDEVAMANEPAAEFVPVDEDGNFEVGEAEPDPEPEPDPEEIRNDLIVRCQNLLRALFPSNQERAEFVKLILPGVKMVTATQDQVQALYDALECKAGTVTPND